MRLQPVIVIAVPEPRVFFTFPAIRLTIEVGFN